MAELTGKDFIARAQITNKANVVTADVGDTCEKVDPKSLGWLLAQGYIAPVKKGNA